MASVVAWVGLWEMPAVAKFVAPVEVTGQTQCLDTDAMSYLEAMSCPIDKIDCNDPRAKGQDGRLQAGVRPPTQRFDDLDNGTVLDNLTGLIWLKDANCLGFDPGQGPWPQLMT